MDRRKVYNDPGHAHFLTFSCYRRRRFFDDDRLKESFLDSLHNARRKHNFLVWAYVIMPEHVHLVLRPLDERYDVSAMLKSIKQGVSQKEIARLKQHDPGGLKPYISSLPGKSFQYSFWQSGGGTDINLKTAREIWNRIHYTHLNPVRRGLVESQGQYRWSSYNAYEGVEDVPFRVDRCEVWGS
jgi:putative transposase